MKFKLFKSNKMSIILLSLLLVVFLSSNFVGNLTAKFITGTKTYEIARVAKFDITGEGVSTQVVPTDHFFPGKTLKQEVNITNNSEVMVKYTLTAKTTGNLPLQLKFSDDNTSTTSVSVSAELAPNGKNAAHTLKVVWPAGDNSVAYSGMVDAITLTVETVQVD